jgi:hypothetical protein
LSIEHFLFVIEDHPAGSFILVERDRRARRYDWDATAGL